MRDFNHTLNVLVNAYFNDTLKHGDCTACAVGNIVGGNRWSHLFCTNEYGNQHINPSWNNMFFDRLNARRYRAMGAEEIAKSGYSKVELMKVEYAFESASKSLSENERIFSGLMAVVDVLAEIHGIDLKAKEEAKLLFVKA